MESRDAWKEWETAHAKRVTASVNRLRSERGWTVRELATRLQSAGWPIEVATLNGILSGGKRGSFSIGEVFALARALNVPPTYLMLGMPDGGGLPSEPLFSKDEASLASAYLWLIDSGMLLHDYRAAADAERAGFNLVQGWLGRLPKYAAALDDVYWQNALWLASSDDDGPVRRRGLIGALDEVKSLRRDWRALLAQAEWAVPDLPGLPAALEFLDEDTAHDSDAPIDGLNTTKQIETARAYWTSVSKARSNAARLDELAERKIEKAQAVDLDELLRATIRFNSLLLEAIALGPGAEDAVTENRLHLSQALSALKVLRSAHFRDDRWPLPEALGFLDEPRNIEGISLPLDGLSSEEDREIARAQLKPSPPSTRKTIA